MPGKKLETVSLSFEKLPDRVLWRIFTFLTRSELQNLSAIEDKKLSYSLTRFFKTFGQLNSYDNACGIYTNIKIPTHLSSDQNSMECIFR